jgi:large subunit ribosomal protein L23
MADPVLYYRLIRRPLVTEKSTNLQGLRNQYTFEVHPEANKSEIRKAVETLFEVKVEKVNIVVVPGKLRRFLGRPGRTRPWKKAVVSLRKGDVIEIV